MIDLPDMPGHRSEVHDRAAPLFLHHGQDVLQQQERAAEIDVNDPAIVFPRGLGERFHQHHSRDIHQRVDAAMLLHRFGDVPRHRRLVRDVAEAEVMTASGLAGGRLHVESNDLIALPHEAFGRRSTYSVCRP
jgi:hypothetical protein